MAHTLSTSTLPATERKLSAATSGYYLGPMPTNEFLSSFFPHHDGDQASVSNTTFSRVLKRVSKRRRSLWNDEALERFINAAKPLAPSLTISNTRGQSDLLCGLSADVSVYPISTARANALDFAEMDLFIQFEASASADPFVDTHATRDEVNHKHPLEKITTGARRLRAALARKIAAMSSLQFRTHCFAVCVYGRGARLFRWDAAGIVVTESFDYTRTNTLARFLSLFNDASASQRGRDVTVSCLDDPWPTNLASRADLEDLVERKATWTRSPPHRFFSLMKVPERDDPRLERDMIVSCPPLYDGSCPLGRSTRPFFAYDLTSGKIVFVKQYWRSLTIAPSKEGDIYKLLSDKDVRHLPTFGCGNDVRDYVSVSQNIQASSKGLWAKATKEFDSYRLYRMSLETIGRPLTKFRSARELVTAIRDAQICHDDAYFKANILHADISSNNIMISQEDGSGFLTDWDLSVNLTIQSTRPIARRGTWQFMSCRLLTSLDGGMPTLLDDRESFFWVLLWVCLLYVEHSSTTPVKTWLEMFDECRNSFSKGLPWGGCNKTSFLTNGSHGRFRCHDNPILGDLIHGLRRVLAAPFEVTPTFLDGDVPTVVPPEYEEKVRRTTAALEKQEGFLVGIYNTALNRSDRWSKIDKPALLHSVFRPQPPTIKPSSNPKATTHQVPPAPTSREGAYPDGVDSPLHPSSHRRTRKRMVVPPSDRVLRPRATRPSPLNPVVQTTDPCTPLQRPDAPPTRTKNRTSTKFTPRRKQ